MKTLFIFLFSISLVFSSDAKRKNPPNSNNEESTSQVKQGGNKSGDSARKQKMQQRKIKLMNETLSKIGVSKEDQKKIRKMQGKYRKRMFANREKMGKARKELVQLQKQKASDAEIELAIQKVTKAFGEKLRLIVKNRRDMEKILGEEKYRQFMKLARKQFRNHANRRKMMHAQGNEKGQHEGRGKRHQNGESRSRGRHSGSGNQGVFD